MKKFEKLLLALRLTGLGLYITNETLRLRKSLKQAAIPSGPEPEDAED